MTSRISFEATISVGAWQVMTSLEEPSLATFQLRELAVNTLGLHVMCF